MSMATLLILRLVIVLPAVLLLLSFCCDAPFRVQFNIQQFSSSRLDREAYRE